MSEEAWETWNVGLWLSNEESYYRGALGYATSTVDEFQEWVEQDIIGLDNLSGIAKDFVLRCLGRVDWDAVMSAFKEEDDD